MADPSRPSRPPGRTPKVLRRFARAQDGAAAVEFAFVAIPFLVLVFAIFELGLVFLLSMTLENALMNVGRQIRTGQLQTSGGTAASFRTAVCGQMAWLGAACSSTIKLDVRTVTSFSGATSQTTPADGKTCWDPGGPGSIVLVRAYYKWPLIAPLLRSGVASQDGNRVVTSSALFANEPYEGTTPSVTCPT